MTVTPPAPASGDAVSTRVTGVALALLAGLWQAVLMSAPTNDDFLHLALAQQLLAGDWPVRDFFDNGLGLQLTLSAAAQMIAGHRLLSEAIVVGVAWAVSTFLVFTLVRRLTGSTLAAVLSALLLLASGPRGYSYPKVIVYAVAATLWWAYVWSPTPARIAALGGWTAAAFYWRPDHGVYVAAGVVLAAMAAHGAGRLGVARCAIAGAVAIALTAPFFLFVQLTSGLGAYMAAGFAQADFQHEGHDWPAWPIRRVGDVVRLGSAEDYAPRIALRWSADSSPELRRAVVERYALTPEASEGPLLQHVRLSEQSLGALLELINEPIVEDTAGIDRSTATLPYSRWTRWERWQFSHRWLRTRLLAGLDEHSRASEAVAMVFYALPAIVLFVAVPMRRHLAAAVTAASLVAFAVFGIVVTLGLLRTPYDVRAVDGVALAAILFAVCVTVLWRAARAGGRVRRWALTAATIAFILVTVKSVSVSGQFAERASALTGEWRFAERMRGTWSDVTDRLVASPPLAYYGARRVGVPLSLAAYARECVPPTERILVLWFAPEIYYYAGRLMAQRHLVFVPGWAELPHEQHLTLTKIRRFAPPLALASSSLDGLTRRTYPGVVDYVRAEYDVAASIADGDQEYLILARRGRPVVRTYGEQRWPCYR